MKLSLKWVEEFTTVDLNRDELVRRIGSQLGAVEEVEDWGSYYDNSIVVAEITKAEDHPDADKLGVYEVNTGDGKVTVCAGDKTLNEGDKVGYIPPGTAVPSSVKDGEPFVIEERELRGVMSQGMMGSAKELLMSDDHEGVLKLDTDEAPGASLSKVYDLDDLIIDIENKMFTHRPDLFGILGLARELAGIQGQAFKAPEWYVEEATLPKPSADLPLEVKIEVPELCPRFTAITFTDIEIKPSPIKVQSYLTRVGLRPINNVVDTTNFGMYLTGQPTHAFDYDKVVERSKDGAAIVVRKPNNGETIELLDGRKIEPHSDAAMVATDKELISVGGSIGGADTEVDIDTKNIVLEAASWDLYSIRRTSFAHGIFTDAVTRFSKGQSPRQAVMALSMMSDMLVENAGAKVASELIDEFPKHAKTADISFTDKFINTRLGSSFSPVEIATILNNVELSSAVEGDTVTTTVPFWRTDLTIAEDLLEEVGRLHGYDNLPIEVPPRLSKPNLRTYNLRLKGEIREILAAAGARDILTYNFVSSDLFKKAGYPQELVDTAYRIRNSLSPELEYMRISILPSIIDKVNPNIRSGHDTFTLFEINKSHNQQQLDEEKLPVEHMSLGLAVASAQDQKGSPYYQAKAYIDHLCLELGLSVTYRPESDGDRSTPLGHSVASLFSTNRQAAVEIEGNFAGFVGEFSVATKSRFKLPAYSAGFELNIDHLTRKQQDYRPISRYPSTTQDVTLETPDSVDFADLATLVSRSLENAEYEALVQALDIYRPDENSPRRITFRVIFRSAERTLKTTEINQAIDALASRVGEIGITRI